MMAQPVTPAEHLAHSLVLARDTGAEFAAAWPVALDAVLDGARDADDWRQALEATRAAWAAAWHGTATPRAVRALIAVARDPERVALDADELPEVCEHCEGPIRLKAGARARRYCSEKCRRDASVRRVACDAAAA